MSFSKGTSEPTNVRVWWNTCVMVVRPLLGVSIAFTVVAAGCGQSESRTVTVTQTQIVTAPSQVPRVPPAGTASTPPPARGTTTRGPVVYVSDGDTIGVDLGGPTPTRVRLLGINAPESKDPDVATECFGPQAARIAATLLPRGAAVTILTDPTQDRVDRYGRLLAYVFRQRERVPVNQTLVERGAARVYVYRRSRPFRRVAAFRAAEVRARAAGLGIWGTCASRAPSASGPAG